MFEISYLGGKQKSVKLLLLITVSIFFNYNRLRKMKDQFVSELFEIVTLRI